MTKTEPENKCRFCGPDTTSNSAHVGCFVQASARPSPPQHSGHTKQLKTDDDLDSVDKYLEAIRKCKVGPQYFLLVRKVMNSDSATYHIFTNPGHESLCSNAPWSDHSRGRGGVPVRRVVVLEEAAIRTDGYKEVKMVFGKLDRDCWGVFNTIAQLIRAGV